MSDGSVNSGNSNEQEVFINCEVTSFEQKDSSNGCGPSLKGDGDALEILLLNLLHVTHEWSIKYGYKSIPPGVILRQACTMVDAIEIAFNDEVQ